MTVYQLDSELWFPPSREYEEHGVVAMGGDLSVPRLLMAYRQGIFPWYNEEEPITWWCPAQRMVLLPHEVKISRSSRNLLNRQKFEVRADTCFEEVIDQCQKVVRKGQEGTWLNDELKGAIIDLHQLGYAHSIEAFENGKLVGGLYGLSLGRMFFGDSMFSLAGSASKIAFITLCQKLEGLHFDLVDCQVYNTHLASLGAFEMPRSQFLKLLAHNPIEKTLRGRWTEFF